MTDEQRGAWVRRIFTLLVLGGAVVGATYLKAPEGWAFPFGGAKKEKTVEEVNEESFKEFTSPSDQIAVLNAMIDGNPDSEKLAEILENLKKNNTFENKVDYGEVDLKKNPELVVTADGEAIDFVEFAGQLDFYSDGRKLGSLIGETDPVKVEAEIRRYVQGLFMRVGADWMPEVPGMQRATRDTPVIDIQPRPATH